MAKRRKTRFWTALLAYSLGSIILSPAAAAVVIVQPEPTDRQWIAVGGSNCHGSDNPNGTPTCPGGGTASGSIDPTTEFASAFKQALGVTLKGGGSTSANALRIYVESNSGFSFASAAIVDTYTVFGPAGDVPITVSLAADATAAARNTTINEVFGSATFSLAIGTALSQSGRDVHNHLADDQFTTGLIRSTAEVPIELTAQETLTITPGVAFNLAYGFSVTGTAGIIANGLNTATIDFALPDGYAISSVLGFSSGSTSGSSDVPEPSALAVLAPAILSSSASSPPSASSTCKTPRRSNKPSSSNAASPPPSSAPPPTSKPPSTTSPPKSTSSSTTRPPNPTKSSTPSSAPPPAPTLSKRPC